MRPDLNALLTAALGVLALTSCKGGEEDTAVEYTPEHDGDYGNCAPQLVDSLPFTVTTGEVMLCEVRDEATCMAIDTGDREHWAALATSRGYTLDTVYCGPAFLDGACCAAVSLSGSGYDDTGYPPDVGRPFLVDGRARTAAATVRSGWMQAPSPRPLPPNVRDAVVARWTAIAQAEHASVAAFSRFSLALLHHGAPADLIRRAHEAALDEVRHAEQAFGLASAWSGASIGPDRLDVRDALDGELELETLVRTLIAEGCIGETLAALEAAEAARHAQDPVVNEILVGIAKDEARHAELAWDALSWVLAEHAELREIARLALRAAPEGDGDTAGRDLSAYGCLPGPTRSRVRIVGQEHITAVMAAAVLGSSEGRIG